MEEGMLIRLLLVSHALRLMELSELVYPQTITQNLHKKRALLDPRIGDPRIGPLILYEDGRMPPFK